MQYNIWWSRLALVRISDVNCELWQLLQHDVVIPQMARHISRAGSSCDDSCLFGRCRQLTHGLAERPVIQERIMRVLGRLCKHVVIEWDQHNHQWHTANSWHATSYSAPTSYNACYLSDSFETRLSLCNRIKTESSQQIHLHTHVISLSLIRRADEYEITDESITQTRQRQHIVQDNKHCYRHVLLTW